MGFSVKAKFKKLRTIYIIMGFFVIFTISYPSIILGNLEFEVEVDAGATRVGNKSETIGDKVDNPQISEPKEIAESLEQAPLITPPPASIDNTKSTDLFKPKVTTEVTDNSALPAVNKTLEKQSQNIEPPTVIVDKKEESKPNKETKKISDADKKKQASSPSHVITDQAITEMVSSLEKARQSTLDEYNDQKYFSEFDPFKPISEILARPEDALEAVDLKLPPLERTDLNQINYVGIISSNRAGKTTALVEDALGTGYIVTIGTRMGTKGGRISEILAEKIVVEEIVKNFLGEDKTRDTELKLYKKTDS